MLNWFRRKRDPGGPSVRFETAGTLTVSSGTILVGDPMFAPDAVRLEGVPVGAHPLRARVIRYPEGDQRVAGIELLFTACQTGTPTLLGEISVDSASVALVDERASEQFWADQGHARIGVLASPQHRTIAKLLRQRFGLRSDPVNAVRSELVQPVSQEIENQIVGYLKTFAEYAEFPLMFFRVETRNTCDQLQDNLNAHGLWCEMVLDKQSGANVLAFKTGFGSGCYSAYGFKKDGQWCKMAIEFIEPEQEEAL